MFNGLSQLPPSMRRCEEEPRDELSSSGGVNNLGFEITAIDGGKLCLRHGWCSIYFNLNPVQRTTKSGPRSQVPGPRSPAESPAGRDPGSVKKSYQKSRELWAQRVTVNYPHNRQTGPRHILKTTFDFTQIFHTQFCTISHHLALRYDRRLTFDQNCSSNCHGKLLQQCWEENPNYFCSWDNPFS